MTQKELMCLLDYDRATGLFTWKVTKNNRVKAGSNAGYKSPKNGYIQIKINGRHYQAHRLAWLFVNGDFPQCELDHIDHDRSNNAINNLRPVSRKQNSRNTRVRKNSYSGVTGVYWDKHSFQWRVMVHSLDGKSHHVGYFKDFDEARRARKDAEKEHGYHPNHGEAKPCQ